MENIEVLRSLPFIDGEYYINQALSEGKKVLAEGAQGSMLDIDFGTYPFVTSSNTISAGACTGLGISPKNIGEVIGITKAYCTRVGSGPFPSELFDDQGIKLGEIGMEFGATTGRPRRCGWLDVPQLKYTIMINGVTQLVMTKIDVLDSFETIKVAKAYMIDGQQVTQLPFDACDKQITPVWESFNGWQESLDSITEYSALPDLAKKYIVELEDQLKVPFSMISTGPERSKLIKRQ
jgi:adenylosuccinate synthase